MLDYEAKKNSLNSLKYLEKQGYLKIFYGDACHFSLNPSVPYAWQPKEYIKIVPQKTTVTTVFGVIAKDLTSHFETFSGSLTTDIVLNFLENFAKKQTQPTVIVLDNASIHTSKKMKEAIAKWAKLYQVFIFFLPPYSPHLNLIEIVWRNIKHKWLNPSNYKNSDTLLAAISTILAEFGQKFTIQFAT
jgi:transposase